MPTPARLLIARSCVYLICFILAASPLSAFQEKLSLTHISKDHGLPSTTIRSITEDSEGLIWIGFEGGGLARYDGSDFQVFRVDKDDPNSLQSDYVNSVIQDSSGQIWVGTAEGLFRYDIRSQKMEKIALPKTAENEATSHVYIISDLLEDSQKRIWAATNQGIFRISSDLSKIEPIPFQGPDKEKGFFSPQCQALLKDGQGEFWVATRKGVFLYDAQNNSFAPPTFIDFGQRDPRSVEFFDIVEDDLGNLWFGHQTGLGHFDRRTQRYHEIDLSGQDQDPEETNVATLLKDRRGFIWVGTFSDGLRIIDPSNLSIESHRVDPFHRAGLQSNNIRCFFEDHNGLVWIGTKFEGIFLYNFVNETFPLWTGNLKDPRGMRGNHVLSILEDSTGTVWIGTKRGGLNAFNRKANTFKSYSEIYEDPNSLLDNRVEAIFEDSQGRLWLGTEKGLSRFDRESETFRNYRGLIVREIEEAPDNKLYIGTTFGLQLFDPETESFTKFPILDGIDISTESTNEIKALYADAQNSLYIGTLHSGFYRYDPQTQSLEGFAPDPENPRSISGDKIRAIFEDARGRIWVGTKLDGLNRFDRETKEFHRYTVENGLPDNSIYGIVEDNRGRLWLTTHNGISRFDTKRDTFLSFNSDYGLQSDVFEPNAISRSRTGEIYVGGDGGFNAFFPSRVKKNHFDSEVVLSGFSVFGQPIPEENWSTRSISLPHDQNNITLTFALTDYSAPGQNEFRHKLEGRDDDWIYTQKRNYLTYNALPPGKYRLIAQGRAPSGDWSEDSAVFDIVIQLPFWRQTAFYLVSSLAIVTILMGSYAFITRRQRIHQANLERLVANRTSDLKRANEKLESQSRQIVAQNEELESHKNNLEQKVRLRTQELEAAKHKAEESDRLKTSFLANMSHEIRTPMNAIIGFVDIICEPDTESNEREDCAEIVKSNCDSLMNLIDDILDISRIEAEQLNIAEEAFDLNKLLRDLDNSFRTQTKDYDSNAFSFVLAEHLDPDPQLIITDPRRLRQILTNLISNAIKFTSKGSVSASYEIDADNQKIIFTVEDTGIGIPADQLDFIWDRFRKIEDQNQKTLFRGTGLGLAITRNLVELLGGEISVTSQLNEGTRFVFSLPYKTPAPESQSTETPQAPVHANQGTPSPRNVTILVAEDENDNYLLVDRIISSRDVAVLRAENGAQAVEMCREMGNQIDLILMDIKMPVLDGKRATVQIKEKFPRLPIIAYTAYASQTEREAIMEYGFDGYIRKPISRKELERVIAEKLSLNSNS